MTPFAVHLPFRGRVTKRLALGEVVVPMSKLKSDAPRGLSQGSGRARWTLVDRFERNGEKYIVLRDGKPSSAGPLGLTETERGVVTAAARGLTTKEIAYEFGITDTTVRVLLMRAGRRCSVRSRRELLDLWRDS
jgi:DNA-binding NarL/FixJ family response regulator